MTRADLRRPHYSPIRRFAVWNERPQDNQRVKFRPVQSADGVVKLLDFEVGVYNAGLDAVVDADGNRWYMAHGHVDEWEPMDSPMR